MPPPEVEDASVQPYVHLVERATTFLADCGGRAHEDALVSHVFGTAGSPMLWRPLLNTMFQRETDIVLRAGGFWCLRSAHAESTTLLVADFVALDVETTGLHAYRQRIIEIALIRYRDGAATARFESFVNPGRSIPAYISKLTGIRDLDVAEAPPFTEIAPDVLDFIGQDRLVGHNVGFDISFVNAELKRAGCGALINERLDTLGLATRLLPNLKKPNLDRVALELGVALSARKLHRAANDAELSGESMLCLAKLAQQQGVQTISDLYAISSRSGHRPHERVGRGRSVLDRSLLATIPKTPGVYLMHDAFDQIVYVGKAKNLRDRVASYYSQPLGYTRKMDGLLESLSRIEVEVVGSELEALLLESQLIKRYQPRYNTALRSFEHYPYIRVDISNAWPRMTLVKTRKEDGAAYFGPFRNKTGARKTVDLINRIVPLRTCSRSFKDSRSYGSPCLELDLRRCLGPCVGRADRDQYMAMVRDVVSFLDGRDKVIYERLWRSLEDATDRLDFEKAARLRRDLLDVNATVGAQRQLRQAMENHTLILVLPSAMRDARELLVVVEGRLWAQIRATPEMLRSELVARLSRLWSRLLATKRRPVEHSNLDETNILNRWLYQHVEHPAIVPLKAPPETPNWEGVIDQVLGLSPQDLVVSAKPAPLVDEDDSEPEIAPPPAAAISYSTNA